MSASLASRCMELISVDRVRELLCLDEATGVLTWRIARGKMAAGSLAGTPQNAGYRQVRLDGVRILEHRVIWLMVHGSWPQGDVDHINGIRSDNRPGNLRDVSRLVNLQNQRRPHQIGTSGRLGVTWDKRNKFWKAAIRVNGRSKHLGRFDDLDAASAAYIQAKRRLHAGCTI